jgi:spermidine synthase
MADVVDLAAPAGERLRVLHVGGGAMSLARYVAATRPTSPQVVLEPDAELVDRVRAELPLPRRSGVKVRVTDGRAGLAALRDDAWDVVLVDAFDDGVVPADLVTPDAAAELARVLASDGLVVLNVTDRAPFPFVRQVVAGLVTAFAPPAAVVETATLRGRREGNVVLLAATEPARLTPIVAALPAMIGSDPSRVLDPRRVGDSFGGGEAVVRTPRG